jgi:mono/diheme cytochrome c family protein
MRSIPVDRRKGEAVITKRLRIGWLATTIGLAVLVAACAGGEGAVPTRPAISAANVAATQATKLGIKPGESGPPGLQLFQSQGCAGCHTLKGGANGTGPTLGTIGTVAATRKPGTEAAAYIRESIVAPNAFVVQGFQTGVMPQTYNQTLTAEQIDQLVAFLLEQK